MVTELPQAPGDGHGPPVALGPFRRLLGLLRGAGLWRGWGRGGVLDRVPRRTCDGLRDPVVDASAVPPAGQLLLGPGVTEVVLDGLAGFAGIGRFGRAVFRFWRHATQGNRARLGTPDGEIEAELVVAADGVRSATRHALFPGHPGPRYSGCTTWRVVVPAPERPFAPHETWGAGRLWGTQPLKDGRIYAYAMATAPAGGRAPDDEKAELLRRFGDWHHPVPEILAAAGAGSRAS